MVTSIETPSSEQRRYSLVTEPITSQSALREPETNDWFLSINPRPRRVPSKFLNSPCHHCLICSIDFQSLVPFPSTRRQDLEAIVLLLVFVGTAVALEELGAGDVTRQVSGCELELSACWELPRRRLGAIHVHLCVLGREEVVVPRLAAETAGCVGHLRRRHSTVDPRPGRVLTSVDVTGTIWLVGSHWLLLLLIWVVRTIVGIRNRLLAVVVLRVGSCIVLVAVVRCWSAVMGDVGLSMAGNWTAVRRSGRSGRRSVMSRHGIPTTRHVDQWYAV